MEKKDLAFSRKLFGVLTVLAIICSVAKMLYIHVYPDRDSRLFLLVSGILILLGIFVFPRIIRRKVVYPDYNQGMFALLITMFILCGTGLILIAIENTGIVLSAGVDRVFGWLTDFFCDGNTMLLATMLGCYLHVRRLSEKEQV